MTVAALIMAASAVVSSFTCTLEKPRVISLNTGKSDAQTIEGLPTAALTFRMNLKSDRIEVVWPDSPIQMSGKQPTLPTSEVSGVALFVSSGPCLFTERACSTMVNYARQPDGSVDLILVPSAITADEAKNVRTPFLTALPGHCVPIEGSK